MNVEKRATTSTRKWNWMKIWTINLSSHHEIANMNMACNIVLCFIVENCALLRDYNFIFLKSERRRRFDCVDAFSIASRTDKITRNDGLSDTSWSFFYFFLSLSCALWFFFNYTFCILSARSVELSLQVKKKHYTNQESSIIAPQIHLHFFKRNIYHI